MIAALLGFALLHSVTADVPGGHLPAASEDETSHRAICAGTPVEVRYGNSETRSGWVRSVQIHGKEIPKAAEALTARLAGRDVDQISFLTCKTDKDHFEIGAVILAGEAASTRKRLNRLSAFILTQSSIKFETE